MERSGKESRGVEWKGEEMKGKQRGCDNKRRRKFRSEMEKMEIVESDGQSDSRETGEDDRGTEQGVKRATGSREKEISYSVAWQPGKIGRAHV